MPRKTMSVVVVADWSQCPRHVHWKDILKEFTAKNDPNNTHNLDVQWDIFRPADAIEGSNRPIVPCDHPDQPPVTPNQNHEREIRRYIFKDDVQVVILNWDVLNSDPHFGSDYTLRWFAAIRGEIMDWVSSGGLLIVEGQALLSVPIQESYDALFGRFELPVSGPESHLSPSEDALRMGYTCKLTSEGKKIFRSLALPSDLVEPKGGTHHRIGVQDMFRLDCAPLRLLEKLGGTENQGWNALYRGWFRSSMTKRRLTWVTLMNTTGRRWNHSTLSFAQCGQGYIFASTMFLCNLPLWMIRNILECQGGMEAKRTPQPGGARSHVRLFFQKFAQPALIAALIAALVVVWADEDTIGIFSATLIISIIVPLTIALIANLFWRIKLKRFVSDNFRW